jgi:D-sedoheptulose 7-phosphate isomerase
MSELKDLVLEWASESAFIKQRFFADQAEAIVLCARQVTERLVAGGKVLAFGNGGSATDAMHIAVEFTNPVIKDRPPFPAMSLNGDTALVTSLANDFDFAEVYARQVEVYGKPGDVLIGLSTSGNSVNVVKGCEVGKALGLLTMAFTGKGGGACAEIADYAFAVPSHNILRIQECHLTLYHIIWDMVHTLLHYEPEIRRPRPAAEGSSDRAGPRDDEVSPDRPESRGEDAREAADPNLLQLYPFLFDK